jgi:hypothetical protein
MEAQKMGLMINYDKRKRMEIGKPTKGRYLRIKNRDIEKVYQFIYLGSIITNNITSEINHRINTGNKCCYGLRNMSRSKLLQKDTKCKIYKTVSRSVVTHGCESWTVTKTDNGKPSILERKTLRNIYSANCVSGVWIIKYNDVLYSLYKQPGMVKMIKTIWKG